MRIVAVAAGVVALLAVGIGAFFLFQPDGPSTPVAATSAPPAAESAPTPTQPAGPPLATLPGQPLDTSGIQDFGQVTELSYLTDQELAALSGVRPSEAAFGLSQQDDNKLIILVVKVRDPATVRDKLADLQLRFELTELRGSAAGVRIAGSNDVPDGNPVLRRAHYASGDYLVRVEVSGEQVGEVDPLFRRILAAQQEALAADG